MAQLDQFLSVIVREGGSDLHIGEGQPPKMRKHGDIAPIQGKPLDHEETMSMMREVCGERNWKMFEGRGDLDFAYAMDAASRFRCNYFKQTYGYGRGLSIDSDQNLVPRRTWDSACGKRIRPSPRRIGPRDRTDRVWQINDPGGADRLHQRQLLSAHRHDRGADRVRARQQTQHHHPARGSGRR